ncbi:TAXI family TRAP transporter solute-binding subunit [Hoyosella altamirensis]|uniref:TAXI family TRAP transporter solute-binding subunit n=1 Tax=Hoyosella altamirensis TaxID=616997 RepID=A0A839RLH1_9ACTN|nr:TAXI family TRAP transporter solute-binding subunit [Hoyosella altamirensis]MBB3036946.1 hypothetical protein [Hoyosella altamirensis]
MLTRRMFLLLVGAAAAGCAQSGGPQQLRLASGESAGTYFQFARLLADASRDSRIRMVPIETDGSRTNIRLLLDDAAELALSHADAVPQRTDLAGSGLAAIGRVYENYVQLVVRADSEYSALTELRGRRIVLGAPGSGVAAVTAPRLLSAAEMTEEVDARYMNLTDAIGSLERGDIDALIWGSGYPTPALARRGFRFLSLGPNIEALQNAYPGLYDHVQLPGTTIDTVGVANLLLTRRHLPSEAASEVVHILVNKARDLIPAHALGTQFLDMRSLIGTRPVPLHPGAAEAYRRLHG